MMWTEAQRQTVIGDLSPLPPRLRLRPRPSPHAPLDGGWWPRSDDPAVELPGLIVELQRHRTGPISHVMLGWAGWGSWPRRLAVAGRVVRISWFETLPAGLLTVIDTDVRRLDLLTVPADTDPAAAAAALDLASHPANHLHAPDLLAALSVQPSYVAPRNAEPAPETVWETDGGHLSRQELAEVGT